MSRNPTEWTKELDRHRKRIGRFHLSVFTLGDKWFAVCGALLPMTKLGGATLEEAKCQATALVQVELESGLRDILGDA